MKRISTFQSPSPRQTFRLYNILTIVRDFQSTDGLSYTETAKHLFIAKQLGFDVDVPFVYPARYPTSPSPKLKERLLLFESKGLLHANRKGNATFFKITDKGLYILHKIEEALNNLTYGYERVASLKELHKRELKREYATKQRSRTSTEELQLKAVRPVMLDLLEENRVIFIDPSLKFLRRSNLIVSIQEQLSKEDVEHASEAAINCLGRNKEYNCPNRDSNYEIGKKGEVVDFVKKLMYGLEKHGNKGFLAQKGELAFLYGPIRYLEKNNYGQIYVIGGKRPWYERKIIVRNETILDISLDHNRELFVLTYVDKNKSTVLAIGVPDRFYDEIVFGFSDYQEATLERIFRVIRPHLNMWGSNCTLKRFYDLRNISSEDDPEDAASKIMLWLKQHIRILDMPQIRIDDPYPVFEKTMEKEKIDPRTIGYVKNCKEFTALLMILLLCLPISKRAKLYAEFCTTNSGHDHVRLSMKLENGLSIPLDLDYTFVEVSSIYQIGGKKS